jgi:cytochrome c oxidase cbb3-type subunit III
MLSMMPRPKLKQLRKRTIHKFAYEMLLCIAAYVVMTLPLQAQQGNVDPTKVAHGEKLYGSNCVFCHGEGGKGTDAAPTLLRGAVMRGDQNGERFIPVLRSGIPGTAMVAFPALSDADIQDIAAFLHARAAASRAGTLLPQTALLVGDAKAGEEYFNGAGKCASCHDVHTDLNHIGTKYEPSALTAAFLTPNPKPATVKVVLPSGETITGVVEHQDEFSVTLRDVSGRRRSFSRDALKAVEINDPMKAHKEMLRVYTDENMRNLLAYLATIK